MFNAKYRKLWRFIVNSTWFHKRNKNKKKTWQCFLTCKVKLNKRGGWGGVSGTPLNLWWRSAVHFLKALPWNNWEDFKFLMLFYNRLHKAWWAEGCISESNKIAWPSLFWKLGSLILWGQKLYFFFFEISFAKK